MRIHLNEMQLKHLILVALVATCALLSTMAAAHGRQCKHIKVPVEPNGTCYKCCMKHGYKLWYAGFFTARCGCTNLFGGPE